MDSRQRERGRKGIRCTVEKDGMDRGERGSKGAIGRSGEMWTKGGRGTEGRGGNVERARNRTNSEVESEASWTK